MDDSRKIRELAALIIEKHGKEALAVVTERMQGRLLVQDYPLVALWALVAEAVHDLMPDAPPQRPSPRPQSEVHDIVDDLLRSVTLGRAEASGSGRSGRN